MASALDVVSFKGDVLNCLELCSSYITALNTVCSTGAVLAQTLTQLFSREVISGNSPFNTLSSSQGKNTSSLGRRGMLAFKNNKDDQQQSNVVNNDLMTTNDLDSIYYDMTEQFLRSWEVLSVSTAGASATIKTETLMSLQEVINQLESDENDPPTSKSDHNNHVHPQDLAKSIEAAKSCLLSYIELQAQFSRSSWKSLNHLSKALKSDESMADPVKKIKKHFSDSKKTSDATVDNDTICSPASQRMDVSGQDVAGNHYPVQGASSSDESTLKSCTSKGKKNHKNKSSSSSQAIKHISGLKEATELLSLFHDEDNRDDNVTSKRGDNKSEKERSDKRDKSRKQVLGSLKKTGLQQTVDQSSSVQSSLIGQLKPNSTSTWPVKTHASTVNPQQPTTFTPIGSGFSHTLGKTAFSPDSWSPWSSSSPWLSNNSNQFGVNLTSEVKSPWKTFPSLADGSPLEPNNGSTSSSSSESCSNNSSLGGSSLVHPHHRAFDPFAPQVNKLFESNNNNLQMEMQRRKLASRTLPNSSNGMPNLSGSNQSDQFGLPGFGSLTYLPSHLNASSDSNANCKRLSYSSDGVNSSQMNAHTVVNQPPGILRKNSEDVSFLMTQRMNPNLDSQALHANLSFIDSNAASPVPITSSTGHNSQQQDPSRVAKTSTWPMKQNLTLLPSSGSSNFNDGDWTSGQAGIPSFSSSGYSSSERCVMDGDHLSFAESILGPLNSTTSSNYQSASSLWSTPLTVGDESPSHASFSLFSTRETNNNSSGLLDKNF